MEENTNVTDGTENSGANTATDTGNAQGQENNAAGEAETKTYTAEELQAESDRRVTEALKTANAKAQADFEKRLKESRAEWEKESKMTAAEREKAAREKAQKQFERERAEYQKERLEFEATKILAEKKYPVGFAKMITAMGEDGMEDNVKALESMLSEYRESVVAELTKGKTPKIGGEKTETDPFLSGFGK